MHARMHAHSSDTLPGFLLPYSVIWREAGLDDDNVEKDAANCSWGSVRHIPLPECATYNRSRPHSRKDEATTIDATTVKAEDITTAQRRNTNDMLGFAKVSHARVRASLPFPILSPRHSLIRSHRIPKAIIARAQRISMPALGKPTKLLVGIQTGPCMSGIVGTRNLRFCLFGDTMNTAARMQQTGRPDRIHVGPCMSGIVGTRNLRFCLFGDTMNTAARMKQMGAPKAIHVTEDVVALAPDDAWEARDLEVKGKGRMTTYVQELDSLQNSPVVRGRRGSTEDWEAEEEVNLLRSRTLHLVNACIASQTSLSSHE